MQTSGNTKQAIETIEVIKARKWQLNMQNKELAAKCLKIHQRRKKHQLK